jgi:hypothetical protein
MIVKQPIVTGFIPHLGKCREVRGAHRCSKIRIHSFTVLALVSRAVILPRLKAGEGHRVREWPPCERNNRVIVDY